jgi:hypothetical protein
MILKENAFILLDVMSGKNMYTQPLFYAFFALTPPCKLAPVLNLRPQFRFNALHLVAFCYTNLLFLMVIGFLFIYAF